MIRFDCLFNFEPNWMLRSIHLLFSEHLLNKIPSEFHPSDWLKSIETELIRNKILHLNLQYFNGQSMND